MLFLEIFLRSAGATTVLLWAVLLIRDARDVWSARLGAVFLFACACALLIHTAEGLAPPAGVRALLLPISSSWIIFLWLAARSFFDDNFRLSLLDGVVAASWLALGGFNFSELALGLPISHRWAANLRDVLSLVLVGHILYVAISGAGSDLVETRRRSRIGFAVSLLSIYLLNKIGETVFGYSELPLWFTTSLYALIVGVLSVGLLGLVKIDRLAIGLKGDGAAIPAEPRKISDEDQKLIKRLTQIIEIDRIYLEPNLSIRDLAEKVGAGEHQLRALINQAMGFRNFRVFLNGYRVKDAIQALSDPAKQNISILSIAMEAGFGSLASFNRAFKQETGMSPSDMRNIAAQKK
jgi:AraC-like DNA-binding protein